MVICSTAFMTLGRSQLKALGGADLPIAVMPHPFGVRTRAEVSALANTLVDEIARLALGGSDRTASAKSGGADPRGEACHEAGGLGLHLPPPAILFLLMLGATICPDSLMAQVSGILSYQGRVAKSGVPVSGTGLFKFTLVNSNATVVYWGNSTDGNADGEPDTAVSVLRFASGAVATIDNSRRATYGYDQRAEVFGSGGMVSAGNVLEDQAVVANGTGIRGAVTQNFFLQRYADAYAAELEAFAAAVRAGGPSPVTGYDGRIAVAIAIAAQESVRHGRPVRLSEVG